MQPAALRAEIEREAELSNDSWSSHGRVRVLGVLNVTPDSFSDGGEYADLERSQARACEIFEEGADALDVGGESTRPGSREVTIDEELRRVLPLLEALDDAGYPLPISIDTRRARVAFEAHARGATILNDTSALRDDEELMGIAVDSGMTVVLMHRKGVPETMQADPHYEDVIADVRAFFAERVAACTAAGIPTERLILDPGLGFGKTPRHNDHLVANVERLRIGRIPVMVGASRKSFVARFDPRPARDRLAGSLAYAAAAARAGADWVRVHDVGATVSVFRALDAITSEVVT